MFSQTIPRARLSANWMQFPGKGFRPFFQLRKIVPVDASCGFQSRGSRASVLHPRRWTCANQSHPGRISISVIGTPLAGSRCRPPVAVHDLKSYVLWAPAVLLPPQEDLSSQHSLLLLLPHELVPPPPQPPSTTLSRQDHFLLARTPVLVGTALSGALYRSRRIVPAISSAIDGRRRERPAAAEGTYL